MIIINYSLAGEWALQVHALALTEHFGHTIDDNCAAGACVHGDNDGGRAVGLLQCHYPYMRTWYEGMGLFAAAVSDTVPDAQIKATASFLNHNVPLYGLDLAIQCQNKGVRAVMVNGQRNPDYLAKFSSALNQLKGASA